MQEKTCENCGQFILFYRRRGVSFSKSFFGQCAAKKYEICRTGGFCQNWEKIASPEDKKKKVFDALEEMAARLAAVEVLLGEIIQTAAE